MSQVTIYLEPELQKKLKETVHALQISQSKWIANLIREKLANEWPADVIALAGAWEDFPLAEELRQQEGLDTPRESF